MTNIVITGAFKVDTPTGRADWTRSDLAHLCQFADFIVMDSVGYNTEILFAADIRRMTVKMQDARARGVIVRDHASLYTMLTDRLTARAGEPLSPHLAMANLRRYGSPFAHTVNGVNDRRRVGSVNQPSQRAIPLPYGVASSFEAMPMAVEDRTFTPARAKQIEEAKAKAAGKAPIKEEFGKLGVKRKVNLD